MQVSCAVPCAGEHLSVIFVTMLLSGSMPIAFFSAALWFVSSYWCDKVELLKLSRRPVIYGNTLSDHVMNLLPYAAVRHGTAQHGAAQYGIASRLCLGLIAARLRCSRRCKTSGCCMYTACV